MKNMQAILILAHKNPEQVFSLALYLKRRFEIYIHFDKKFNLDEIIKHRFQENNINVFQEYNVNWGSWSIVQATCFLMKEVLKNREIKYLHVISGQDWPTVSPEEIHGFYEGKDENYIRHALAKNVVKAGEPIIQWVRCYFNYDEIKRRTLFGKIYHRVIFHLQSLLRVDKLKKYNYSDEIYQGSQWMDLHRSSVEYLLDVWEKNENIREIFRTSFCPDEFWIQTILANSPFKKKMINENFRYILWKKRYNNYPAILDETSYDQIKDGHYQFMRKIDIDISKELLKKIGTYTENHC